MYCELRALQQMPTPSQRGLTILSIYSATVMHRQQYLGPYWFSKSNFSPGYGLPGTSDLMLDGFNLIHAYLFPSACGRATPVVFKLTASPPPFRSPSSKTACTRLVGRFHDLICVLIIVREVQGPLSRLTPSAI